MKILPSLVDVDVNRVAIMQPYFFPYLGYFALIKHSDFFISFDTVQYIRKGWINRNRVLKPNEGWQYLTAPVQSADRDTVIKDILVVDGHGWKDQILRQIEHYKKRSPYYKEVRNILESCFVNSDLSVSRLNVFYLDKICQYLEIPFHHAIFSDMDIKLESINAPDEWALHISSAIGANTYINPPGGREFFIPQKYRDNNMNLQFLDTHLEIYNQRRPIFEAGLSIIDVLMFNNPEEVRSMLDKVSIETVN